MPDFGYGQDNYILKKEESSVKNNWLLLTELLNNPEKFAWLMNYVKLKGLEKESKQAQEALKQVQLKREQWKRRQLQENTPIEKGKKNPSKMCSAEMNELMKLLETSQATLTGFKKNQTNIER